MRAFREILRGFLVVLGVALAIAVVVFLASDYATPNLRAAMLGGAMLGALTGGIAHRKGESFWEWAFFGFMLAIVALPWAIFMKPNHAVLANREIDAGRAKLCPWCMNLMHPNATICPHCHQWVGEQPPH